MSSQRYSELKDALHLNRALMDEGRSLAAENNELRELNAELLQCVRDFLLDSMPRDEWLDGAWKVVTKAKELGY